MSWKVRVEVVGYGLLRDSIHPYEECYNARSVVS